MTFCPGGCSTSVANLDPEDGMAAEDVDDICLDDCSCKKSDVDVCGSKWSETCGYDNNKLYRSDRQSSKPVEKETCEKGCTAKLDPTPARRESIVAALTQDTFAERGLTRLVDTLRIKSKSTERQERTLFPVKTARLDALTSKEPVPATPTWILVPAPPRVWSAADSSRRSVGSSPSVSTNVPRSAKSRSQAKNVQKDASPLFPIIPAIVPSLTVHALPKGISVEISGLHLVVWIQIRSTLATGLMAPQSQENNARMDVRKMSNRASARRNRPRPHRPANRNRLPQLLVRLQRETPLKAQDPPALPQFLPFPPLRPQLLLPRTRLLQKLLPPLHRCRPLPPVTCDAIIQRVKDTVTGVFDQIDTIVNFIPEPIKGIITPLVPTIKGFKDQILGAFNDTGSIVAILATSVSQIEGVLNKLSDQLVALGIPQTVFTLLDTVLSTLARVVQQAADCVKAPKNCSGLWTVLGYIIKLAIPLVKDQLTALPSFIVNLIVGQATKAADGLIAGMAQGIADTKALVTLVNGFASVLPPVIKLPLQILQYVLDQAAACSAS